MHKPANSPIKVIGGQHRFEAIRFALENSVDVLHGVKVYFALDMPQRLLVVNTSDGYGTWRPYGDDSDQFALTFKRFLLAGANTSTALCGPSFPGQNVGANLQFKRSEHSAPTETATL